MSAARLPLPYRDSCAHLLIPLNRCRYEEFYLPWKCEVRHARQWRGGAYWRLTWCTERATLVREMPIRGVQGAREEDGRVEGGQGRRAKQLGTYERRRAPSGMAACIYPAANTTITFPTIVGQTISILGGQLRKHGLIASC
jgi:hypothetical protein